MCSLTRTWSRCGVRTNPLCTMSGMQGGDYARKLLTRVSYPLLLRTSPSPSRSVLVTSSNFWQVASARDGTQGSRDFALVRGRSKLQCDVWGMEEEVLVARVLMNSRDGKSGQIWSMYEDGRARQNQVASKRAELKMAAEGILQARSYVEEYQAKAK
jgi:hypothetical protein